MASPDTWQALAAKKVAEVHAQIPPAWLLDKAVLDAALASPDASVLHVPRTCGLLTSRELDITESYDATALLAKIHAGALTAVEVTTAFCKRATIAHQLVNCLTEIFFDKALEQARALDAYFAEHGRPKGPLHGLPISLKDLFDVEGVDTTVGYVAYLKNGPAAANAPMAQLVVDAGAVLFVKTNLPQTVMAADTVNNVFGRTVNPHRLSLGPGGSSGGEGALVALRGALIGIGTDIGGSTRVPALCCGVLGFRPSAHRLPYGTLTAPGIASCAGPLATSARDLRLFFRATIDRQPWRYDWAVSAIPWRDTDVPPTLSIGVIVEDPGHPVTPPVRRAVRSAAAALAAAGHRVVFLPAFPSVRAGYSTALDFFNLGESAALQTVRDGGEPLVPVVEDVLAVFRGQAKATTVAELGPLYRARNAHTAAWHRLFLDHGLDVLVTPSAETTALPQDQFCLTPYTALWNLLDFPACVVPYLHADATIDVADPRLPKYKPDEVHGAPSSIQVVGLRLQDEKLVGAVEVIEEVLK